jgi:hypothetical protein
MASTAACEVETERHGPSLGDVLRSIAAHPIDQLVRQWNWKSALLSSLTRATIFFAINASAGFDAAVAAAATELWLRVMTSGFYGALTAALRRAEPAWHAMGAAMVLLPLVAHLLEWIVHWTRGTAHLAASVTVSVAFTAVSTAFNVFVMRRGALIVGEESRPLADDLRRMPALVVLFIRAPMDALVRLLRRLVATPS